jgi:hypothetical protein
VRAAQAAAGQGEEQEARDVCGVVSRIEREGERESARASEERESARVCAAATAKARAEGMHIYIYIGESSTGSGGAGGGGGGGGRVRRSVPAVSTVNLDKHSHVTLLQDADTEQQILEEELTRILSRAYEVLSLCRSSLLSRYRVSMSLVSCLLSLVSCHLSLVSCFLSLVSCLLSLVPCPLSLVSSPFSPGPRRRTVSVCLSSLRIICADLLILAHVHHLRAC